MVASALYVGLVAQTLPAVAPSSALRHHLDILMNSGDGTLEMPIIQNKLKYRGFAQRHKIIPKDGVTSQEDDDDEEVPFIGLTQMAQPGVTYDGAVIYRGSKTFIGHFSAKRESEKHCAKLPRDSSFDVHISLIAVRRSQILFPSWTDMKDVMKKLVFDPSSTQPMQLLSTVTS